MRCQVAPQLRDFHLQAGGQVSSYRLRVPAASIRRLDRGLDQRWYY